jgi:tetratricopeptide (TPR) repeat protein
MKVLLLALLLSCAPDGDRERGLALYRDGKYAEAAAAFRAALVDDGDDAGLHWNLALACWRSGDLAGAESAVEKYAALAADARTDLHAGLLGALRFDEAKALEAEADAAMAPPAAVPGATPPPAAAPADPLPKLEQALAKAGQARDWFVKGAAAAPAPELLRNTERSLRYVDALQKKIDELKQQQKEQDQNDQKQSNDEKDDNQQKNEQEKPEEPKPDEKKPEPESEEKKPEGEPKPDEKQPPEQDDPSKGQPKPDDKGQERPEPQQGGEPKPEPKPQDGGTPEDGTQDSKAAEPKPGEALPEPKPGEGEDGKPEPRQDAPGEVAEGKELSPEQQQRLMDALQELDQRLKAYRARAKSGRRPVERDW